MIRKCLLKSDKCQEKKTFSELKKRKHSQSKVDAFRELGKHDLKFGQSLKFSWVDNALQNVFQIKM